MLSDDILFDTTTATTATAVGTAAAPTAAAAAASSAAAGTRVLEGQRPSLLSGRGEASQNGAKGYVATIGDNKEQRVDDDDDDEEEEEEEASGAEAKTAPLRYALKPLPWQQQAPSGVAGDAKQGHQQPQQVQPPQQVPQQQPPPQQVQQPQQVLQQVLQQPQQQLGFGSIDGDICGLLELLE
eukprot:COSAG06_NODE_6753_length_2797_cov_2.323202_2_plen_183_part_00